MRSTKKRTTALETGENMPQPGRAHSQTLQSRSYYRGGLPGEIPPRHTIPPVAGSTVLDYCLTSWKSGHVHKTDVTITKNYLNENEIDELNRIVVMWLDYVEDQARRHRRYL